MTASVLMSCLLLIGGTAQAEQLNFAVGFPSSSATAHAAKAYAEVVGNHTEVDLSIRVYELSLLNLAEMSGGVKEGIADIGYVLSAYFPAEYPNTNMAAELSMLLALNDQTQGKEGLAYAGAMQEYIMFHCPECNAEFERQNQVYTGGAASSPYGLLCTQPVTSPTDLKGARLRA